MPVPFVDLAPQHAEIDAAVRAAFDALFAKQWWIGGPDVERFERAFADWSGAAYAVGVANGTDAIEIALRTLDLPPDAEVIVPANTFVATAIGVLRAGARPVLADVGDDGLIDVTDVARRIGPRTRVLLPVHLMGQCADLRALQTLAADAGLVLMEDHAQSQGAHRDGLRAGTVGRLAPTSFYPGKNLGAYGDGGAILTGDEDLAARCRRIRNYGSEVRYHHPELGFNSRLDVMQAAVLEAKLAHLSRWNGMRRDAAARYDALLSDLPAVTPPVVHDRGGHVWHLYVVRVPDRDRVAKILASRAIGTSVHYPTPLHLHGAMATLGYAVGDFPQAERLAGEILSLPMFPHLGEGAQAEVVAALREALG